MMNRLWIHCAPPLARWAGRVLVALALVTAWPATAQEHVHPPAAATAKAGENYSCPMHPDVHAGGPGKCPKCGMALVAAKPESGPKLTLADLERMALGQSPIMGQAQGPKLCAR